MRAPAWLATLLLPVVNVALAFVAAGVVVLAIGEDPLEAVGLLVLGAFGSAEAVGYTLFYATNLVFTGLAVAVAFHAGLFNIGGEGQAYLAGLGVAVVALSLDAYLPGIVLIPLCVLGGAAFGAAWALVPAWLQARRGSHIVITTIMFNFIAASLMVYLLVNVFIKPGQMNPETRAFTESAQLPPLHAVLESVGIGIAASPLNLSVVWALLCCVGVWLFLWRTRWGYALRVVGKSGTAAAYAGIDAGGAVLLAMGLSGALASGVALNEILGVQHRLLLDFVAGYGFTGIAVALMGRNHPVGILLAAVLFGALFQGGAELAFEMPAITRDMVVVIQGLIILFCGALELMARPWVERLLGVGGGHARA